MHFFIFCKKCTSTSCVAGSKGLNVLENRAPFCGNDASASEKNQRVPKGVCGRCQVNPTGGGGPSKCSASKPTLCRTPNSCGGSLLCCFDGRCAATEKDCPPSP